MRKVLIALVCFCSFQLMGQTGVNIKAGLVASQYANEDATSPISMHLGQIVGFDAILEDYRLYINPGFYYLRTGIGQEPIENLKTPLLERENYHLLKMQLNIGRRFLRSKVFSVKVFGGGNANFLVGLAPDNKMNKFKKDYKDIHFGVNAGLGLQLKFLFVDVSYEYGLTDFLQDVEKSSVNTFTLTTGLFF